MSIVGARPLLAPALSEFPALFKLSKYTLAYVTSFFGSCKKKFEHKRVDNETTELSSEILKILVYLKCNFLDIDLFLEAE